MSEGRGRKRERKRRPTPPLTHSWLRTEAIRHLERWPATEMRVRRLLRKRAKRAQSFHGGNIEEAQPLIDAVIHELRETGILDDSRFAQLWIDYLRRRGTSRRMIFKKLTEKGVSQDKISVALEAYTTDDESDPEHTSAVAYATRRRLGPYRRPFDPDPDRRRKDLAAMARAGFSYGIAKAVLNSPPTP